MCVLTLFQPTTFLLKLELELTAIKKFRDPIHGFIHLNSPELDVVGSPIFQRTRNIRQLSLGHYVYHGAEHSRFGHMIGAAHVAGLAFDSLKRNTKELEQDFKADDVDRSTLRMAALLHDIGHTPFSHALEHILGSEHEKYSQIIVKTCFEDTLQKADIDVDIVNNLIAGDPYPEKPYLSKIISGQIDVDRLDYILRDSYYSGVSYGKYDLNRIIDQLAVVNNKFVVLEGGYEAVEQLIFARYQMYQQVYFHKTKRAFELMLQKCGKILVEENNLKYPKPNDLKNPSKIKDYVQYDDRWFLNLIYKSSNPQIKVIADMIKNRKPYLEIYSPIMYRSRRSVTSTKPYDPTEKLGMIQTALQNSLAKIEVDEHEFLADVSSRPLYKLMPDYTVSDTDDEEGSSISIYYKNSKLIEPIEKRSHVVYTLGINQAFIIRGFVIPQKYNQVRSYLKDTFELELPERDSG